MFIVLYGLRVIATSEKFLNPFVTFIIYHSLRIVKFGKFAKFF